MTLRSLTLAAAGGAAPGEFEAALEEIGASVVKVCGPRCRDNRRVSRRTSRRTSRRVAHRTT